ncbi:MAG TPA: addiction module protein [bacterium]|nr:addiction module protein [bacterium]
MTSESQVVLQRALALDAVERAELIEALFRSFDKSNDRHTDALWAGEAESRIDAFEQGKIKADSAAAVLKRVGN